jgi:hypothetical protein
MSRICSSSDLPVRCSVCLQPPAAHDPKIQYIDFNAAYDGPVVDSGEPGVPGVYMEKIVICELCVKEGAMHLGLREVSEDRVEAWKTYAEQVEDEVTEKDKAISHLAYTVGVLLDYGAKRPMGRPQIQGPETHEDEVKALRKKRTAKERLTKASSGANGN